MKIIYKYASRSRPDNFFRGLDSIINNSADKKNLHVLCTFDSDDTTMLNHTRLKNYEQYCTFVFGTSKNKIDAVNRDLEQSGQWDILVNMSDDMLFTNRHFDNVIRADMRRHFPDTDGVLHYNDGFQKANVMTLSIMGRKYFDRFGYIYHPDYVSLFADNEATDVAKMLNRYVYMGDAKKLFKHLHHAFGMAPKDALYQQQDNKQVWDIDEATFNRRKAMNFGLNGSIPKKTLAILILSTDKRRNYLERLKGELNRQIQEQDAITEVELKLHTGEGNIGKKRNELLQSCTSEYCCFFDDDDLPNPNYLCEILDALQNNPDVVSLTGLYFTDGKYDRPFYHSIKHNRYYHDRGAYYRYPNHLNPIKTSIAKQFKFPEINHGEDTEWATLVHKAGVLKKEAEITAPIYHYFFRSKK